MSSKIIWTQVDEAPALATYSLLPILRSFTKDTGISFEPLDISLAGRIIASFSDRLPNNRRLPDALEQLGLLVTSPDANIIKLPNISASIPQLQAAINELQNQGYDIPNYPESPRDEDEKMIQERFSKVLGSAVNPVLRQGNSNRRPPVSVKQFAQKNPHRMMKPWPDTGSQTRVAHMQEKDFYGSESSTTINEATKVRIEFVGSDGELTTLKEGVPIFEGDIIDSAVMNVAALRAFFSATMEEARRTNTLLSLHLKATMMKVSDPIIFGHCVSVYFQEILDKHSNTLKEIGVNVNNGISDVIKKITDLPADKKTSIEADLEAVYASRPALAMVDSRRGITNLHCPNDIIVDASMPNVIRDGGRLWNADDELQDTIAMVPDRCYATIYQVLIEDCQRHGQFDPATMGSVSNVGLMARKAEEYGSHDKTFIAQAKGMIRVVDTSGSTLLEQTVEKDDIFRMCQTRDDAIRDWVSLAVTRAKATKFPAIFWLDHIRAHDSELINKVNEYLTGHDTDGLDIRIMTPMNAMRFSLDRIRQGKNAISVTGNVLRDYLTDLFPILELGTSAKMLSIVPLLNGGGLFETGAGGSAPKHVQQFLLEGHLRWDSLGEYCAVLPSFELISERLKYPKADLLGKTLGKAIKMYLEHNKSPSRKVGELDNRGSSFYLALYWAKALAAQDKDTTLKERFGVLSQELSNNESLITDELVSVQGRPVEIGGYYHPDKLLTEKAMRPSKTFNKIIDDL